MARVVRTKAISTPTLYTIWVSPVAGVVAAAVLEKIDNRGTSMRKLNYCSLLLATPIVLSSGALMVPMTASAQIEEIMVTARQREESLQDVPASITAFTSGELERMGAQRAEDFVSQTAGVVMVDTVEVGDSQVNIRGLNGARDGETNFAFILDGVLYTNPSAFNREYADLAQVEILKGPQGALYGRSAAAGAIIVTTKKPTNETEASVEIGVAEFGTTTAQATVAGALSEDTLFGRLSVDYRDTDGFLTNSFLNADVVNDYQSTSIAGRLIWEPSDALTIDTKLRYGEVDAGSIAFNASFALPGFAAFLNVPDFFEEVNDHEFIFAPNVNPENEQGNDRAVHQTRLRYGLGDADGVDPVQRPGAVLFGRRYLRRVRILFRRSNVFEHDRRHLPVFQCSRQRLSAETR